MKKAVVMLLCLAVWAGLSALPRIGIVCDDEPETLLASPCCPDEQLPSRPTWDARCCEVVYTAALVPSCTPPSESPLLSLTLPTAVVAVAPLPTPTIVRLRPRQHHSAIPPGSGLRLLHTTVLRI